jgi:hypothetical protein
MRTLARWPAKWIGLGWAALIVVIAVLAVAGRLQAKRADAAFRRQYGGAQPLDPAAARRRSDSLWATLSPATRDSVRVAATRIGAAAVTTIVRGMEAARWYIWGAMALIYGVPVMWGSVTILWWMARRRYGAASAGAAA